ncbi:Islet cell autoantigen 1-like [Homarus americanus]|uniref:Islet cell autoantigen 1-like n=1 Tax=Homarus americanus TaxID=6706 RepID=A0A8J5KB49_HOMAM|nr:Islet cell autoantigen 1-like [Homarus americanus]
MTQQIHSYSGQSYDRWVERNSSSSTLGKVQKQFWFTKSAVIRKFGKKEDEHVLLADYQNKICVMAQEENAMGRLLKEYGKQDRSRAGKMMTAVGKSLSYTAQQRVALRNPLVRLFQEVDTFHTRAVEDTSCTVTEMEKIRTEYRGALMWMKNISQDFNPDQYHQLEKFREVQGTVKQKKAKFDRIKLKSLQKIDLLAASRCNMFSHALIVYQNNLITFSDKTSKTLISVANNFRGYQPYDFQVIKELAEPPRKLSDDAKEEDEENLDEDEETFFNAEYHDDPEKKNRRNQDRQSSKKTKKENSDQKKSDSLMNLLDCTEDNKSDTLISLNQTEGSSVSQSDNNENSSQIMDFLTNNPEVPDIETDTQQMLKELFDSPSHQPLPVFGSEVGACRTPLNAAAQNSSTGALGLEDLDNDPFSMLQNQSHQQPQNMFLPSQLLDFGMQGWQAQMVQQATGTPLSPQSFPSPANKTSPASSLVQPKRSPTSASTMSNQNLKQEVQKLDWYKVFQDIDPLGDPGSAIFSQVTDEDKKC